MLVDDEQKANGWDELQEEPHPVQIVIWKSEHKFQLNEQELKKILLQDHVRDKNVVVVSVAGAFRKGKSFLLDFFLRYLRCKYSGKECSTEDWLGTEDVPLRGFPWRGGSERDTSGILMWSEVFTASLANGDDAAIVLLDTQGTFDSDSTVRDCATVFGLSTMLSSIQVYNLSQNIQEDDLQHLQFFTEYGRLALDDTGKKPFQKLQFLVRDWSFPYDAEYGESGGKHILDKRLQIFPKQHPELQSIRKHIRSCFSDISCFLMPHPGLKVATNPKFEGKLSDIEADFKECLRKLVPLILAPENLVLKEMSGVKIKAKELLQYFKSYVTVYSGDQLPEPKSMLLATAEANNLAAVAAAKEMYNSLMEEVCGGAKPYLHFKILETEHNTIKLKALDEFSKKRKMGGEDVSEAFKKTLESDMDKSYAQYKLQNESKNIFTAVRTPTVLVLLAIGFYILSSMFGLVGLYGMMRILYLLMICTVMIAVTWSWVRYSGEMSAVVENIDELAAFIWENVMKAAYDSAFHVTVQTVFRE